MGNECNKSEGLVLTDEIRTRLKKSLKEGAAVADVDRAVNVIEMEILYHVGGFLKKVIKSLLK